MLKARYLFLVVLLTACNTAQTATPTPTVAAVTLSVATAPPATAALPTIAPATVTPPPPIPPASDTPVIDTATPDPGLTATTPITSTEGVETQVAATQTAAVTDKAEFVADVTVPDGSDFAGGAKFTKTWRIKNVGATTWTTDYTFVFVRGANMSAVASVPLPKDVPPGETVDISVEMTAPAAAGTHTSLWWLRNPEGAQFGVGPNFNEAIYVQIDVIAGTSAATATRAPTSTSVRTAPAVPTPSGPLNPAKVTNVTIRADNANVTGGCPHTFVFTAILNIEGGGVVRYQLEASAATEGFIFNLPAPLESTFTTNGPHTFAVSYTLEMRNTVQGQVWLHVLSPNDLVSDKVAFSLTCPTAPTAPPPATSTTVPSPTP